MINVCQQWARMLALFWQLIWRISFQIDRMATDALPSAQHQELVKLCNFQKSSWLLCILSTVWFPGCGRDWLGRRIYVLQNYERPASQAQCSRVFRQFYSRCFWGRFYIWHAMACLEVWEWCHPSICFICENLYVYYFSTPPLPCQIQIIIYSKFWFFSCVWQRGEILSWETSQRILVKQGVHIVLYIVFIDIMSGRFWPQDVRRWSLRTSPSKQQEWLKLHWRTSPSDISRTRSEPVSKSHTTDEIPMKGEGSRPQNGNICLLNWIPSLYSACKYV